MQCCARSRVKMCRIKHFLVAVVFLAIFVVSTFNITGSVLAEFLLPNGQSWEPWIPSPLTMLTAGARETAVTEAPDNPSLTSVQTSPAESTVNPSLTSVQTSPAESTENPSLTSVQTSPAESVYVQRRLDSQAVCRRKRSRGRVSMWTRYNNTAYCILPKVGCTFWKNVFRYLHGDTGGSYSSPFDIPRVYTHTGPMKRMRVYRSQEPDYLNSEFRFLFVREPYSRLFSAYVDKLLLPDFWQEVGRRIASFRPNKTTSLSRCGSDISFKEFLEFVVTKRPLPFDNHWRPAYTLCSPCLFLPHMIGKMETFAQDVKYVLRVMNSSWMLDSYSHHQHVLQELDMITKYNFAIWKQKKHIRTCASRLQLSRRLWQAFQINGYLPSDRRFPDHLTNEISAEQFVSLVQKTYKEAAKNSSSEWQQQKERMMLKAYEDIRSETLDKLKTIYKYDFLMFGYDQEPAGTFQHRKRPERI